MKTIAVIAVVCYLFVVTESLPSNSAKFNKCSSMYKLATDRAQELVAHNEKASNEKEKCFLSCYLKERDYLTELNVCSTKHNLPTDRARELAFHRKEASNDNEKCFLGCYLKERKYLVDGKIDFNELLENHKCYQPDLYDEMKKTFDECEKNMNYDGKNECEVAFEAYNCAFSSH